MHHPGAVPGDAAGRVVLAGHEAGDVLQKEQRHPALISQFDEVRAFQRTFAEQHAVVGDDAHRIAPDAGEAGHQGGAVTCLEFVELAAIHQAGDDLAHVVGFTKGSRQHAVNLLGRVERLFGWGDVERVQVSGLTVPAAAGQVAHDFRSHWMA